MNLNYLAFSLIAFFPLVLAILWYHPKAPFSSWAGFEGRTFQLHPLQWVLAYILSFLLVYGYMNLIIHQLGFYQLFFTEIMQGNEVSKQTASEFLAIYGQKYRYFKHGVFHGVLNAFMFALPFISFHALMEKKGTRYVLLHFSYWLITSMIMGGLIAEFI